MDGTRCALSETDAKTPNTKHETPNTNINPFHHRAMMDFFLCVLGMVLVVEGLPYFAFPERMKRWVARMAEMPDEQLRKLGIAVMALGLLLVYLGRR